MKRRTVAIAIGVGILVVLLAVGLPVGHVVESSLTGDVTMAQADLQRGTKLLEQGYKNQDASSVQAAAASFASSRDRLLALGRQVRALDGARSGAVPGVVRSRVATLDAAIDMGVHVDQAGMTAARALLSSGLLSTAAGTAVAPEVTAQLTDLLGSIRVDLEAANSSAGAIDVSVLPASDQPSLRKALDELKTAVMGIAALWPSLGAVMELLGLNGPRTYLIEQTNPAELRSGGGFIGTVSLVHADRGRVTLAKSLPVEAFDYCDAAGCVRPRPEPWQPGYVAPPPELSGPPLPPWSRLTAWSLEDSGFYPDFASNAAIAESFARKLLNTPIDGVVAIDYYAVAPLLQLTGPVALPQYKLTLTSANFVDTIVGLDLARDPRHKDVIAAAASKIVSSLSHLAPADVSKLLGMVEEQVRSRHLQVHFDDAGVQKQAGRLAATDTFNPTGAREFMMETEDNYGGSKADYFIDRRFTLALSVTGDTLHHTLTVDLHDGAPADKPYIGPHYYAYLRMTVPAGASHLTVSSTKSPEYAPIEAPARRTQVPPAGSQVAGGWIFVMVGSGYSGNYEARFSWDTPWKPDADGAGTIYWQKQPGTVRDPVQVTWSPGMGPSSYTATGQLTEDRVLTLRPAGVTFAVAPAPGV